MDGRHDAKERLKEHWAFTAEGTQKYFDSRKERIPEDLGKVENRINQNELIMRVTLLEGFLKEIHREVLRQKPALLRSDRQIPLGRLVALGPEKILEEEVEREVQSVDRKSIGDRAKYFLERLSIDWFDGTIVPLMEWAFGQRNEILHFNPDAEVSSKDLGRASVVGSAVPWVSVAQAAILYPGGFKMIEGLEMEKAQQVFKALRPDADATS
jgi:hypothetical protein